MKWNISAEYGDFFLTVNDVRCVGDSGKPNVIERCSAGNNKDEIWFQLKGEKNGKRLRRDNMDLTNERLSTTTSNSEFLMTLEEMGITVIRRTRKSHSSRGLPDDIINHIDPLPTPAPKQIPEELKILQDKSAGHFKVSIDKLIQPTTSKQLRDVDPAWVKDIKDRMKEKPAATVTRIPVLYDKEIPPEEFKLDSMEMPLQTLGGNHMVAAMKDIMREEGSNPYFECLRTVDVEVYTGLNQTESLFISSWHNSRCKQKNLHFQDKVKVARKIYMKGEEQWKDEAVVALGDLERRTYRKEALGTVFSVASYSEENWEAAERLFAAAGDTTSSYPQNIFRQLQSLPDHKRTTYLLRAIGSNGVKIAGQIGADKRKDQLKALATRILEEETWEEVETSYVMADELLTYSGDISNPEGRLRYAKYVKDCASNEKECWTVTITVKRNGKEEEINQQITNKYTKKIIKELKNQNKKNEE